MDLVSLKIYPCIGEVLETKSSCRSYHSFKVFHQRAIMRKEANNTRDHIQDMHLNFIILIPIPKEDRKLIFHQLRIQAKTIWALNIHCYLKRIVTPLKETQHVTALTYLQQEPRIASSSFRNMEFHSNKKEIQRNQRWLQMI